MKGLAKKVKRKLQQKSHHLVRKMTEKKQKLKQKHQKKKEKYKIQKWVVEQEE